MSQTSHGEGSVAGGVGSGDSPGRGARAITFTYLTWRPGWGARPPRPTDVGFRLLIFHFTLTLQILNSYVTRGSTDVVGGLAQIRPIPPTMPADPKTVTLGKEVQN